MGVPKGTDNFKSYRVTKQDLSITLLRAELMKAEKRKMQYPSKATLVADMADRTRIHRTTLVRNPIYHRELLRFLSGQAGASTFLIDAEATPELLRAKLIDAQMEIGRLNSVLESTKQNSSLKTRTMVSDSEAYIAYVDTVWVMRRVLERVNSDGVQFEIDMDNCEIRDLAAAPGRQKVCGGARLRPFVDAVMRLKDQEI